ncbi:putative PEP-binding protein [Vibrio ostreicida]|uniref:putative PEP-binding protein n=1 Tax=Vibrio ostreicida TaxID=526588 RepID=UPI000970EFFB|nr:putative PEP-binding protein [Vibrio ostreicida]
MKVNGSNSLHPELNIGDALPGQKAAVGSDHLFVSMADLISEHIVYHPCFKSVESMLSEVELNSIKAILGESAMNEHFVATLVDTIIQTIEPTHEAIRIGLSNSDSGELSALLGGQAEPSEVNSALGLRGVSRYAQSQFHLAFVLECQVIKALQLQGVAVDIVVPFVRTLSDAAKIIDLLAEQGLPRGVNGLHVFYTVDVPSAALLSERLLPYFDGVAINVENLAQFTLGVDRQNQALEYLFDPQCDPVIDLIRSVVKAASRACKPVVIQSSGMNMYRVIQQCLVDNKVTQVVMRL